MSTNRVFYAIHGIGFKEDGIEGLVPTGREAHGVQSVGLTTTFNLEQVFELGQLEIYEQLENKPDVEITTEKVLDDTPLVYHLSTAGSAGAELSTRTTQKCQAVIPIYPDTYTAVSGDATRAVTCSGMYVSSLTYTFPVDGNSTESVTLIGSDKVWATGVTTGFTYSFDNTDSPGVDGTQRREDVIMGEGPNASLFPTELPGITSSGTNPESGGAFASHIQTVTVTADLGRTDLFELGRKSEYYKYADFPVEVTTTIDMTETDDGDNVDAAAEADNTTDQTIKVKTLDNTQLYMGTKNRLQSVSRTGGDATGGNVTLSYSYLGFNTLTVTNPTNDPDGYAHV